MTNIFLSAYINVFCFSFSKDSVNDIPTFDFRQQNEHLLWKHAGYASVVRYAVIVTLATQCQELNIHLLSMTCNVGICFADCCFLLLAC